MFGQGSRVDIKMDIKETETTATFAAFVRTLRKDAGLTQARIAADAGISAGYYASIEGGKCLPPPATTLARILGALHCQGGDAEVMREVAASERGFAPQDAALPDEVQRLIGDLRVHGPKLPTRFIRALRTTIREAVD